MFGSRRHRQPDPPLISNANPSAASAAQSAFKRRESTSPSSLSSAAAAAALRARPHTPTNVAEVQTKRTVRRSASISSNGSAGVQGSRPGLERRGSSGSMTERSFRSPSPRRPQTSGGGLGRTGQHRVSQSLDIGREAAPPVPSIPKDVVGGPQQPQHRKANSLGFASQPLRLASQKLKDGQAPWFGGAVVGDLSSVRTWDVAGSVPPKDARPDSRSSSVNFSYPSRVRVGSPPVSPQAAEPSEPRWPEASPDRKAQARGAKPQSPPSESDKILVYDPNSRRMVPRSELLALEREIQEAAEKPRPHKKKPAHQAKPGSHLAQGTVARARGTAVRDVVQEKRERPPQPEPQKLQSIEEQQPVPVPAASVKEGHQEETAAKMASPVPEKVQEEEETVRSARFARVPPPSPPPPPVRESVPAPPTPPPSVPELEPEVVRQAAEVARPMVLGKKPSIVREEPEQEAEEEEQQGQLPPPASSPPPQREPQPQSQPQSQSVFDALDAVPMKQTVFDRSRSPPALEGLEGRRAHSPRPVAVASFVGPPKETAFQSEETPTPAQDQAVAAMEPKETQAVRSERTQSNSPARTTRFGPIQESLAVRHSPPPRSISPRKSALKQTSPSRGASPSDDTSEASAPSGSGTHPEPRLSRKKPGRVSFDDGNPVVVGEAASPDQAEAPPVMPSPQTTRRPWFSSIGKNKKKEMASLEDDEIVMQPCPPLPSFSSVQDRKQPSREQLEERSLVRPLEPDYSPSLPGTPAGTAPPTPSVANDLKPDPLGQSSDAAIGSVLAREQASSRIAANISRFREPLPPVVTSIEGSGYVSDSESMTDSEAGLIADTPTLRPEDGEAATTIPEELGLHTERLSNGSAAAAAAAHTAKAEDASPKLITIVEEKPAETPPVAETPSAPPAPSVPSVPAISVTHPSQEKLVEPQQESKLVFDVPGTFPEDESDSTVASSKRAEAPAMTEIKSSPIRRVTFEPVVQTEDGAHAPQTPGTVLATHLPPPREDDTDSDTGSSIYSDAYEDLSEIEGDGFQSLDAVVESPITTSVTRSPFDSSSSTPLHGKTESPAQQQAPSEHAASAVAKYGAVEPPEPRSENDWEKAKAYWRSLTAEKRAQLEQEALEEAGVDGDLEEGPQETKPRRKKSVEKRVAEKKAIQEIQEQAIPERSYMIKPGTKVEAAQQIVPAASKTSPRDQVGAPKPQKEPTSRIRKSMRASAASQPSLSQPASRHSAGKLVRPTSFPPSHATGLPSKTQGVSTISEMAAAAPHRSSQAKSSFLPTTLRRRGSDSSESSFRRSRTTGTVATAPAAGGGFGFRRTMREGSTPPLVDGGKDRSSRFSLRSLSPAGSPFRRSSVLESGPPPVSMGQHMRMSMRDSAAAAKPAKSSSGGGGMHLSSLVRSHGSKLGRKSKSKFGGSRFGDSSDEDEGPSSTFHSRFDESSDEEVVPAKLPPVEIAKAIMSGSAAKKSAVAESPRLPEEEESSSEALDSSEEEVIPATGGTPSSFRLRPASLRNPGRKTDTATNPDGMLMSMLKRRKTKDNSKIQRGELLESAARRDTKLERSLLELEALRGGNANGKLQEHGSGRSPRLKKRIASAASGVDAAAETWPLPVPITTGKQQEERQQGEAVLEEKEKEKYHDVDDGATAVEALDEKDIRKPLGRPATISELGAPTSRRPGLQGRRTLSLGASAVLSSGGDELLPPPVTEKRRKKFAALRRMFRLDD